MTVLVNTYDSSKYNEQSIDYVLDLLTQFANKDFTNAIFEDAINNAVDRYNEIHQGDYTEAKRTELEQIARRAKDPELQDTLRKSYKNI